MSTQTKPVYLKLRDLIAAAIIDGRYAEGKMLPSVRALAAASEHPPWSARSRSRHQDPPRIAR